MKIIHKENLPDLVPYRFKVEFVETELGCYRTLKLQAREGLYRLNEYLAGKNLEATSVTHIWFDGFDICYVGLAVHTKKPNLKHTDMLDPVAHGKVIDGIQKTEDVVEPLDWVTAYPLWREAMYRKTVPREQDPNECLQKELARLGKYLDRNPLVAVYQLPVRAKLIPGMRVWDISVRFGLRVNHYTATMGLRWFKTITPIKAPQGSARKITQ